MSQQIVTGANCILYVNGKPFARVSQFRWTIQTPSKEIRGIDVPTVMEFAPTLIRVAGSMTLWRTKGDGGVEGAGLAPIQDELPRGKYFSLMLIERITDTVLFRCDQAKVEHQDWDARTKALVQGTVAFVGITSSNEVGRR